MGPVQVASKKVPPTGASTAKDVEVALRKLADPDRAAQMQRFFKTGPGEYGHGDKMLGISVPHQRAVARQYRNISVAEALVLLHSPWHEVRLTALFLLVHLFRKGEAAQRRIVFDGYLANLAHVNNWDLVDSSAPYIVGAFTADDPMPLLKRLVRSRRLWDRRVAAISTLHHLAHGSATPTVFVATALLHDQEDLIHKATGWVLREMGKRVSITLLRAFLDEHAATMPRTMLRYALEKMNAKEKSRYMAAGRKAQA
jgi:3-methyladenine DNA glycosylase AlkD